MNDGNAPQTAATPAPATPEEKPIDHTVRDLLARIDVNLTPARAGELAGSILRRVPREQHAAATEALNRAWAGN